MRNEIAVPGRADRSRKAGHTAAWSAQLRGPNTARTRHVGTCTGTTKGGASMRDTTRLQGKADTGYDLGHTTPRATCRRGPGTAHGPNVTTRPRTTHGDRPDA